MKCKQMSTAPLDSWVAKRLPMLNKQC